MKEGRFLNIHVSTLTLIKIVAVVIAVYLLYLVADIIGLLFASLIFSSAIEPMVKSLEKMKINRALAIIIIYVISLLIISVSIYLVIPPIIQESKDLTENLPLYFNRANGAIFNFQSYAQQHNLPFDSQTIYKGLANSLDFVSQSLINTVSSVFNGFFSFFLILVITFYMTIAEKSWIKGIEFWLPKKRKKHIASLIADIQQKIGWWFRGQLSLCFIIFLMTYMSLSIFGIKYALVLAIIAGIFEIIPYLGPTLSAIPAVFITLTQSPILALFILFVYIIIQSVENNILVPKIMQKAVGLDPIVSIAALMVGFKLGGVIGAILSIPVATAISVIIKDLLISKAAQRNIKPIHKSL